MSENTYIACDGCEKGFPREELTRTEMNTLLCEECLEIEKEASVEPPEYDAEQIAAFRATWEPNWDEYRRLK